jgi:hypothetical protein
MDLEARIAAALERRGLTVTPELLRAIDRLIAAVEDHSDTRGRDPDAEDVDDPTDDDPSPTRMIDCPNCGERLPIALDLTSGDQDGIQDCEVCCRPIRIRYRVDDGHVQGFRADGA